MAVATVTLPLISRSAAQGNKEEFRGALAHALRLVMLLTIPSAIGLMILAEPIISLIYEHGRFTAASTAANGGRVAVLCDRVGRLFRGESAGAGVLRAGSAESADGGEFAFDRVERGTQLRADVSDGAGASRAGAFDERDRDGQFSAALRDDAALRGAAGDGRVAGDAHEIAGGGGVSGRGVLVRRALFFPGGRGAAGMVESWWAC